MRLIGLVGKRGSGKSTIAEGLRKQHRNLYVVAFADTIKRVVRASYEDRGLSYMLWGPSAIRDLRIDQYSGGVLPFSSFVQRLGSTLVPFVNVSSKDIERLYDILQDVEHGTAREAVRQVGAWGREIDPLFWLRCTRQTVERLCLYGYKASYTGERGLSSDTVSKPNPFIVLSDVRLPSEARFVNELGGLLIRVERDNKDDNPIDTDITETAQDYFSTDLVLRNDEDARTVSNRLFRLTTFTESDTCNTENT